MKSFSYVFLMFFLLTITMACAQEEGKMDWEAYDPPSTLVVPEHIVTTAKFPFIDIHNHQFGMPTQDLNELIREMDKLNMKIMVNLSGRGRGSEEHLKGALENVSKTAPNRFLVFTNINLQDIDKPGWTEETVRQIERDAAMGAVGLKIYKSQGMSNTDSQGNRISIDDPRITLRHGRK